MPGIFETVLSNTLAACALAGAAWLASRRRRPALAHGLWILVLLKLCTPPLFRVPLGWLLPAPVAAPGDAGERVPEFPFPMAATAAPAAPAASEQATAAPTTPAPEPIDAGLALLLVWAGGSAAVLGLIATRTRRLSSLLRHADPASAGLDGEVRILCRRLGIARAPELAIVAGCVTPMLLASPWRARILLPQDLCSRMSPSGVRTLLVHELAHFARRDHQVRWLEVACAALFWWHPLVWCARRALRNAEEDCCDAWVVWALPGSSRTYAEALVQTVQFLSAGAGPLPVAATGMGPVQDLNRRLTMIMNPTTPRSLSRLGRILVLATAAAVLPTLPAFAQVENESRNNDLQQVLRQEREHRQKLEDVLEKLEQKHKELAQRGRMDEAQQVENEMKKIRLLEDRQRADEDSQSQQGGNQDGLLEALKKAVHALREQNDERAAATVAHHLEELSAQRRQGEAPAKNQWLSGRDARRKQFVEQEDREEQAEAARQEARNWEQPKGSNDKPDDQGKVWDGKPGQAQNFDGRQETKPDSTQWKGWAGAPNQGFEAKNFDVHWQQAKPEPAHQETPARQDHRLDELADQVARLSKMVEQLAGRLEESDKKTRGR